MQITLKDLEIRYEGMGRPLLRVPARRVESGARILLRGSSGSGKTSLLHVLTGLMRPSAGDVQLGEQWLGPLNEGQRTTVRRQSIGIVFQRLNILDHLTAAENVQLGAPGRRVPPADVLRALERLDMAGHADKPAWQLSLGEQQRVAVARVLATHPRLVVADEPTSSLDEPNAHRVLDALFEASEGGATLLVATHDQRIADRFAETWTVSDGVLS